jgi:hypothetical protein
MQVLIKIQAKIEHPKLYNLLWGTRKIVPLKHIGRKYIKGEVRLASFKQIVSKLVEVRGLRKN